MFIILGFLIFWNIVRSRALICGGEILDNTNVIVCPGPFDKPTARSCCGSTHQPYCCENTGLEIINENIVKRNVVKRSTEATEPTVNPETMVTQEGFRDGIKNITTKVKQKVNGTITDAKTKLKEKVEAKVQEKIEKRVKMPIVVIIGIVIGIAVISLTLCVLCCCLCPFCFYYQHKQARNQQQTFGDVQMQPLTNTEREYPSVQADAESPPLKK